MVLNSPYAQITGPSGGSRSSAIVMACWPDGICCSLQHTNADDLSRQCGQCFCRDCPVGPPELAVVETTSTTAMTDQLFAESTMGDSMDTDLLPEKFGETWVAAVHNHVKTIETGFLELKIRLICLQNSYCDFAIGNSPIRISELRL